MKKLLVLLIVVGLTTGCGLFRSRTPSEVRLGDQLIESELARRDMALRTAGFLYGKLLIGNESRKSMIKIGDDVEGYYHDSVDALADYREGRVQMYTLENNLNKLSRGNIRLESTVKAYLDVLLEVGK